MEGLPFAVKIGCDPLTDQPPSAISPAVAVGISLQGWLGTTSGPPLTIGRVPTPSYVGCLGSCSVTRLRSSLRISSRDSSGAISTGVSALPLPT